MSARQRAVQYALAWRRAEHLLGPCSILATWCSRHECEDASLSGTCAYMTEMVDSLFHHFGWLIADEAAKTLLMEVWDV